MRAPLAFTLIKEASARFLADHAPRLAASISYYTLFALAPVLLVAISVAGAFFGPAAVRGELVGQIDGLIGRNGAEAVQTLLESATRDPRGGLATAIGGATLLLACSGAFLELQAALNRVWSVKPRKKLNLRAFLVDRAQSLGLVIAVGFLLMVSLLFSALLSALEKWLQGGAEQAAFLWNIANTFVSLIISAGLFGALFKILPDVRLQWRDVAVGAVVTALLFAIGKHLIGLYLGRSGTASAFGAAGSVIVLLLWVHYTSLLVLWGAEFTRVWSDHYRERAPGPRSF